MRSIVMLTTVVILLAALAIVLGANAGEPGASIAIGVIFGVFAAVPVGLGIALVRRDHAPRQPTTYITHQHVHLYHVNDNGQPEQISEASRTLTTTR